MRLILIASFCVMAVGAANAQQPLPSPEIRALNMRVGTEINANLQCSTNSITLQDKLTAADAEVKRLTEKYEPKKADDPAK